MVATRPPTRNAQPKKESLSQESQQRQEHPFDEIRDLLRLLVEYGLYNRVTVSPMGTITLPIPQSFTQEEVQALRERVIRLKGMLVAYFMLVPQEDWPACFFYNWDEEKSGQIRQCVRGHPYDLCRGDDKERTLRCRCFYDWDFATRKRIGKDLP